MKEKFASIVMLNFHRPGDLAQSIGYLHRNTTYPFELIVVDDGSNDDELGVLYELKKQGLISSIVLNCGDNMGVGTGVNRGFSIAKGDYLIKADSDIQYYPGWLEEGVRILEEKNAVAMVGFFKYHYPPCKWDEQIIREENGYYIVKDFVSSVFMIKREIYQKYGPLEEHSPAFAEDVCFKLKLQKDSWELALTKEDFMFNWGFGLSKSTLYTPESTMEKLETIKVHDTPKLFATEKK